MQLGVIGVVGGRRGIGSWYLRYLSSKGFDVAYSSPSEGDFENIPYYSDNKQLVENSDVIILAVPIGKMAEVLEEIFPYLEGKKLIEVCSVKKFIIEKYKELREKHDVNFDFHSIHPMYGDDIISLTRQGIISVSYEGYKRDDFIKSLLGEFEKDGALIFDDIDYREHDKVMAIIQGLNHFNLFVSAKAVAELDFDVKKYRKMSSPTYRIFFTLFTRYMFHNPDLYMDIQMYNEDVLAVIEKFQEQAQILHDLIKNKDREGYREYVAKMQPVFNKDRRDYELSNRLIDALGHILSEK